MLQISTNSIDPFQMVEKDVKSMSGGIKELLGSDHPVLEQCAKYFFEIDGGKKIRPTMVPCRAVHLINMILSYLILIY